MWDFSTTLLINILLKTVDAVQESLDIDQASPSVNEVKRTLLEQIARLQASDLGSGRFTLEEMHQVHNGISDKTLKCVGCGQDFVFTTGEQMFFSEKQFLHEPKHCKRCKATLGNVRWRRESSVICAECGSPTVVPFLPSQGRPVLCRACFSRAGRGASIPPGGISSDISQKVEAIENAGPRRVNKMAGYH